MASVFGDKYTDAFTDGDRVSPAYAGGQVHVISDFYEAAALAAASDITMGAAKLPANAVIVDAILQHDAMGANTSIALTDGTADIIADAASTDAATGASAKRMDVDYLGTTVAARAYPVVQMSGAGAATGKVEVTIFYTIA